MDNKYIYIPNKTTFIDSNYWLKLLKMLGLANQSRVAKDDRTSL